MPTPAEQDDTPPGPHAATGVTDSSGDIRFVLPTGYEDAVVVVAAERPVTSSTGCYIRRFIGLDVTARVLSGSSAAPSGVRVHLLAMLPS